MAAAPDARRLSGRPVPLTPIVGRDREAADRRTGAIYSNFLPFAPPEAIALHQRFERTLYGAR